MEDKNYVSIGKIVGVHGIKGVIKICLYDESRLKSISSILKLGILVFIEFSNKKYEILWSKPYKKNVLLALKNLENRSLAESLVGFEVFISKKDLPSLENGEYYWEDIIGLDVYSQDSSVYFGKIEEIIQTDANDVYVIKNNSNNSNNFEEILIPAVKSVVLSIDLKDKIMKIDLPEFL